MPRPRSRTSSPRRRPSPPSPHAMFSRRLTVLTTFFVLVGLVYGGILISLQARGNAYAIYVESPEVPTGGTTETVTVQAMRGEIYDRNGKPLVTNVYSYDLELDHASLLSAGSVHKRNDILLSLLDSLTRAQKQPSATELCPFEGTYPSLTYHASTARDGSSVKTALDRVLAQIKLSPDTDVTDLIAYYLNTYSLNARTDGIPMYTDAEIDALLRIYYDMDARVFSNVTPYTLAHDVTASFISEHMEKATPGVRVSVRTERVYHYPGYASHILGRVGRIFAEDWAYYNAMGYPMNAIVGVSGCESAFESILHGADGEMRVTLDAEGRVISKEMLTQPIAGQDIRLTIDIDAQIAAEDALRSQGRAGAAVAMNSQTGDYLAIASAPTYDTANFSAQYETLSSAVGAPLVNRALSADYAMGDLAHLVTATAGLGEGVIQAATLWEDGGTLTVGTTTLTCPKYAADQSTHGSIGVASALREGCDVLFGALGLKLGNYRFSKWETALGLGLSTGIELTEGAGRAANAYPGTDAMVTAAAAGQGDARTTPAQLCALLSTVLEGGTRRAGHLLGDIRDFTSGEIIYRKSSEILSTQALNSLDVALLKRALCNNVLTNLTRYNASTALRENGLDVGQLGAITDEASLSLVFAAPVEGATTAAHATVTVAVVLEGGTAIEQADTIGLSVLDACY